MLISQDLFEARSNYDQIQSFWALGKAGLTGVQLPVHGTRTECAVLGAMQCHDFS